MCRSDDHIDKELREHARRQEALEARLEDVSRQRRRLLDIQGESLCLMRSNLWIAQEFMAMSRGSSKAGFIVDDLCLVDKGIRRGISQDIDELDSQERRLGRLMDEEADAFRLACLKARGQEGAGKP